MIILEHSKFRRILIFSFALLVGCSVLSACTSEKTDKEVVKKETVPSTSYETSSESNHSESGSFFNDGGYRVLHLNGDVDVKVYNDGELVAAIENEEAKEVSSIVSGTNEYGQKQVILPKVDSYEIEIKARKNTTLNYGVDVFNASEGEYIRFVNYFDVKMKKGEVVKATASRGDNVNYALSKKGKSLKASSDLKDEDAKNAYYTIEVVSEDENKGLTSGGVFESFGHYVLIQAEAKEGYQFVGWFVNDKKVSNEKSYLVRVEKPLKYTAKFKKKL